MEWKDVEMKLEGTSPWQNEALPLQSFGHQVPLHTNKPHGCLGFCAFPQCIVR